jgi:TolB-like protein
MSASADDDYFSDGITEDIIAQLSQIASLKVISRTSVMRYKKTEKSTKEIASELGVSHMGEGSVRRAGSRLRIVAQLIEARTDEHLWSCTFDREMTDVFAMQSEVAERIADGLRTKLAAAPITVNFSFRTWCLAAAGRAREAREQLEDVHRREEYVWPIPIALTYACLGEMDTAFEHLTRCYDDRVAWVHLPFSPTFDRFHDDPRFETSRKKSEPWHRRALDCRERADVR